jgi:hypothetical protein
MHLTAGQNAALPGTVWSFAVGACSMGTASAAAAPTVYALIVNGHKRASITPGGPLDLTSFPTSVARIVCAADWDIAPPNGLSANLIGDQGTSFEFTVEQHLCQPAMIIFELYRRGDIWKLRAVGQGYAGGRQELLADYGLPPTSLPACAESPAGLALDGDLLERMWMIFEDAARTTAAFTSARDYATVRLDDELSSAVANPATRHTEAADQAATQAHSRHDDLIAQARADYDRDALYLRTELEQLDRALPPSMASWTSPAWRTASSKFACGAIRLGNLLASEVGDLRIPYCVKTPLRRPVWISSTTSAAAEPIVAALVLRLLAATPSPAPNLDVVDLAGGLRSVTDHLAEYMTREVVTDHRGLASAIDSIAIALDVAALTAEADNQPAPASIVVLSDFGFGVGQDALQPLSKLVSLIGDGRLSLVVVGETPGEQSLVEPFVRELYSLSQVIPVGREGTFVDPWTKGEWSFHADSLPADIAEAGWQPPLSLLAALTSR